MSVVSFIPEDDERDAPITAWSRDFIAAVGERISARRRQERQWFEDWKADYDAAGEAGDEDGCELLLDILSRSTLCSQRNAPTACAGSHNNNMLTMSRDSSRDRREPQGVRREPSEQR